MTKMKTQMGFAQNVKSSVTTCTMNQLYAAMDATITNDVCAEISDALEKVKRGEMSREDFETFKRDKKKELMVLTPHATFTDGQRQNKSAVPSGLSMYDVDHIPEVNGKSGQIGKIFRLAYDCGFYGQERVGIQSVTGRPQMRWNWNASCTIQRGQQFFRSMMADGTLSRLSFSTIITYRGMAMPVHGIYDEKFSEALKPYIDRLNAARGIMDLPQAQRLIQKLDKEAKDTAWLCDDEVYEKLSYRAVVSAWLRAMVLYIAEGKWSKDIENFVLWTMRYDMWCKMHFFGEQMHLQMAGEEVRTRGPKNMLDQLKDTFTHEDAQTIRIREHKKKSNPTQMLCTWIDRGYITRDEDGVYHKTPTYLKRKKVA